ncbi:uncharacterized protein LOC132205230 isoform X2 [Neocloeon triangulifer]|uniref:uncharacterized protein LOC132205230 isoform X2 n=1 Tax=Neocloeon triangulifer TaxID=2078957 RepID=UPI00286F9998|nr:uncharacterized protein LOC132205230 isoform X2 [Neocloeon triangulifer]
MLFPLFVASAVLMEAAFATHQPTPEDSPWVSAAHQGIRLSTSILPRLKSFAEKRHQSLLPYHPVVRFRGLGGPGEAWPDAADLIATSFRPLTGDIIVNPTDLDAVIEILKEANKGAAANFDAELKDALSLSAGDLLQALEAMSSKQDTQPKGIRFGIRRR